MLMALSSVRLVYSLALISPVLAEIFPITGSRVPSSWELDVTHVFFVYGKDDAPAGSDDATLIFEQLSFKGDKQKIGDYAGLEMSVVKYEEFLARPTDFCCTQIDMNHGRCTSKGHIRFGATEDHLDGVYKEPIVYTEDPKKKRSTRIIHETGVYILVVSNCGLVDVPKAKLAGLVKVKNPYGYLSGIDYYKMPFYLFASIAYLIVTLLWLVQCVRHLSDLFGIQKCMCIVALSGFAECLCWFAHYVYWNEVGYRMMPLFGMAIFFSVVKSIFSYMLLLVGCMGWGITTPSLSRSTIIRISACTVLYTILDLIRLVVMSGKDAEHVAEGLVLGVLLPLAVLNGVIVYWVFGSLGKSIQQLTAEKQEQKLKHFQCLWRVIFFAVLLQVGGQFCEVATLSRSIEVQWQTQWVFADGVSHVIFIIVLSAMMWLWRPHSETQRYAYCAQLDNVDKDEDIVPSRTTPTNPNAAVVGASDTSV